MKIFPFFVLFSLQNVVSVSGLSHLFWKHIPGFTILKSKLTNDMTNITSNNTNNSDRNLYFFTID